MYSATNYVPATTSTPYQINGSTSTCDNTVPNAKFTTTDDTSVSYQVVLHQNFTVTLDTPEIKERKPTPIRKPHFQPPMREIASPWQAKSRLTQQRPRDGLR